MARPRTPTNILDARGSFKRNPQRLDDRKDEPEWSGDVGGPPEYFSPEELIAWNDILSTSHAGVISKADRVALEMASVLLASSRILKMDMRPSDRSTLLNILGRFGMTPSDRSKVAAPKKEKENPFAKFVNKRRGNE